MEIQVEQSQNDTIFPETTLLTHWSPDKIAKIFTQYYEIHFLGWQGIWTPKSMYIDFNFLKDFFLIRKPVDNTLSLI